MEDGVRVASGNPWRSECGSPWQGARLVNRAARTSLKELKYEYHLLGTSSDADGETVIMLAFQYLHEEAARVRLSVGVSFFACLLGRIHQ